MLRRIAKSYARIHWENRANFGGEPTVHNRSSNADFTVRHRLSPRQVAMVLIGGQIPLVRSQPES